MRVFLAGGSGAVGKLSRPRRGRRTTWWRLPGLPARPTRSGHWAPSRRWWTRSTATPSWRRSRTLGRRPRTTSSRPSPTASTRARRRATSSSPTACGPRARTTCSRARGPPKPSRRQAQSFAGWPDAREGGPSRTRRPPARPGPLGDLGPLLDAHPSPGDGPAQAPVLMDRAGDGALRRSGTSIAGGMVPSSKTCENAASRSSAGVAGAWSVCVHRRRG